MNFEGQKHSVYYTTPRTTQPIKYQQYLRSVHEPHASSVQAPESLAPVSQAEKGARFPLSPCALYVALP